MILIIIIQTFFILLKTIMDFAKEYADKVVKEIKQDLEILILNNEDDFDRGLGKHIIKEYLKTIS